MEETLSRITLNSSHSTRDHVHLKVAAKILFMVFKTQVFIVESQLVWEDIVGNKSLVVVINLL